MGDRAKATKMRRKSTGGLVKKPARTSSVSTTAISEHDGADDFELWAEYDDLVAALKLPPRQLSWQDFANEYHLCSDGLNPHRWKKEQFVPEKKMEELFGPAFGPNGRHGYHWADCKHEKIIEQINHIHPIVYQHPKSKIPKLIANQFAWGIAYEHFEKKPVSWAMFGQETNKTQQERYLTDVTKINWCREQGLKVTSKSWRKVTVPNEYKSAAFEQEGKLVKWVKKEENQGSAATYDVLFAKYSRKDYIDNLRRIIGMEIESMLIEEKGSTASLKDDADQHRLAELNVKSALANVDKFQRQAAEFEEKFGKGSKEHLRQLDIVGLWTTMQEDAETDLATKAAIHGEKEASVAELQKRLAMKRVQQASLDAEFALLAAGRSEKGLYPTPMVYPIVDEVAQNSDGPELLRITVCSFCDQPFPNSDIVVASCKHVYHPWCAHVVFSQGSRCVHIHCKAVVHPDWHRSFGWGKPDIELEELAKRLQCDDEHYKEICVLID